jgi:hypothetical protein
MLVNQKMNRLGCGALFLFALALAGCSISVADLPIGPSADAVARPNETGGYLPVHDLPPDRQESAMAPSEQAKVERELIQARDRQEATAAIRETARK